MNAAVKPSDADMAECPALEKPRVRDAVRELGITYSPSFLLEGWWLSGLLLAVRPVFRRHVSWCRRAVVLVAAAGAVGPLLYYSLVRPRLLFWGATREEVLRELSGDAILPNATSQHTRAVTIHAPPLEVWEWLAQIGYGRGGWYSHDRAEAVAGTLREGHSATSVYPDLPELRVGDLVRMSPWTGMRVAVVKPGRLLVLHSGSGRAGLVPTSTWTFCLESAGPGSTRLLVRHRSAPNPRNVLQLLADHLGEVPHFIMERQMMLGLKRLAERRWREAELDAGF